MSRMRSILGLIAGGILILSSAAHSIFGWLVIRGQLDTLRAPSDLILGLKIGWQFGAVAMLALGVIVVLLFLRRFRGERVSTLPASIIAALYLLFGTWAMLVTDFDPFFLIFIVPAILLALAGSSRVGVAA